MAPQGRSVEEPSARTLGQVVSVFERFTERARHVIVHAQEEARTLGHNYIGTEHLLLGTLREGGGVGAQTLTALSVDIETARAQLAELVGRPESEPSGHIPFTPRAKKVLELSLREALDLQHDYIGTEHILLGLVREGKGLALDLLARQGVDGQAVREKVLEILTAKAGHKPVQPRQPTAIADLHSRLDRLEQRLDHVESLLTHLREAPKSETPSPPTQTSPPPQAQNPPPTSRDPSPETQTPPSTSPGPSAET